MRGQQRRERRRANVLGTGRRYAWGEVGGAYRVWDRRGRMDPIEHEFESNAEHEFRWLEQDEWERRRRRRRRLTVGLVAVAGITALAGSIAYGRLANPDPVLTAGDASIGRYANPDPGYSFVVPRGWTIGPLESDPDGVVVARVDGDATIEVDPEPIADLDPPSGAPPVSTAWGDVAVEDARRTSIGGIDTIVHSGTATDSDGSEIRFAVFSLDAGTQAYVIRVWVPRAWDVASVMPQVEEVVESFRPAGG
jgi:hypothetical protein